MKSPKITMENFISQENQILSDKDAKIKALKEEEKKVFDDSRKALDKLIADAKETGLFKMRLGDYLKELERITGILPGTLSVDMRIVEKIEGDIRKIASARQFDNSGENQIGVMLYCNHPGRGFITSFTAPFKLLNNDFADGTKFRDNLNIEVFEEGGTDMSYVSIKESNQENMILDLSEIMKPGMMSECKDDLISAVKKREMQKQDEMTK